jgi:hypothetical protein
MKSLPNFALVAAALVGLAIVSVSGGAQREAAVPAQPFWQLQGAGPVSPREIDAVVEMRNRAREALVASTVVASR